MTEIIVYSKQHCPLCDKAIAQIEMLKEQYEFSIRVIDIYEDDELLEKYQLMIPVVEIEGEEVDFGQISEKKVLKRLQSKNGEN
ncbi:glutaredoxin family protein [Halalkalibacter hemicellulosilyticus]|uniref:Glutaredoxin family protein n=1 Tax=Halalkalibacter hemicellulosilyticusJCM 9152 TaxID=1236971 RepID=W4QIZ3_9BACI|nr:glutaredoxin family protein [Halalkalibacter hemicellulosilyticus]GAE31608.1 glutaredoxin family protein [Halalkalibacter hemicellulosilyticusJCM 9152]